MLFNLGMTYADMEEYGEAVGYLRRCLEVSEGGESHIRKAFALLINACGQLERHEEAWDACQQARSLFPKDTELRFREALLHHHFGRLGDAEAAYRAAIEVHDERHFTSVDCGIGGYKARHNLAVVYKDMGCLDLAEEQCRAALAEAPNFRPALRALGDALIQQGRHVTAQIECEKMLADDALRSEGMLLQARLAESTGDIKRAQELLQELIDSNPNDDAPLENLSRLLFEQGDPASAEDVLETLANRRPDDPSTYYNLGTAQLAAGMHDQAADSLRRSIHLRPQSAMTHLQLGSALKAQGNHDDALLAWREAQRLAPDNPAVLQTLAEQAQLAETYR